MNSQLIVPEDIYSDFLSERQFSVQYLSFDFNSLQDIFEIGENILKQISKPEYSEFLKTAMKELMQNSIKATLKRLHFEQKGLDMRTEYSAGMQSFQEFLNSARLKDLPSELQFSCQISFQKIGNTLFIRVLNFGTLLPQEIRSIEAMLDRGRRNNSVADLLEDESRLKEGGGLGLSMIIVIGKSLHFSGDFLSYKSDSGLTEFCLKIPV